MELKDFNFRFFFRYFIKKRRLLFVINVFFLLFLKSLFYFISFFSFENFVYYIREIREPKIIYRVKEVERIVFKKKLIFVKVEKGFNDFFILFFKIGGILFSVIFFLYLIFNFGFFLRKCGYL